MSKTTTSTEYGAFGQIMRRVTLMRESLRTRRVTETWEYNAFGREICYTEETDYPTDGAE